MSRQMMTNELRVVWRHSQNKLTQYAISHCPRKLQLGVRCNTTHRGGGEVRAARAGQNRPRIGFFLAEERLPWSETAVFVRYCATVSPGLLEDAGPAPGDPADGFPASRPSGGRGGGPLPSASAGGA